MHNRKCSLCDSDKTYIEKDGYEIWPKDKITGLFLCKKCYCKQYNKTHKKERHSYRLEYYKTGKERPKHKEYLIKHPERIKARSTCRIQFKGERISLPINPRTGQCCKCGVIGKRTHMHHEKGYDDSDVLDGVIELCGSCHSNEHWESRKKTYA